MAASRRDPSSRADSAAAAFPRRARAQWVLRPQNSLKWSEEVFRWLDEWCGGDDKAQQQRVEADAARESGAIEYSAGPFE